MNSGNSSMSCKTLPEPSSDGNNIKQISGKSAGRLEEKTVKFLRSLSYQKAVTLSGRDCRLASVTASESTMPVGEIREQDEDNLNDSNSSAPNLEKETISSPSCLRTDSPHRVESSTSLLVTSNLEESPPSSNIPRSVSFNDRLLGSTKMDSPLELRRKSKSVERSSKDSNSESSISSTVMRRLLSTPGRMQNATKDKTPESETFYTSPEIDTTGKRTIKNLTSNIARRLSFRKRKIQEKSSSELGLSSQMTNGLLSSEDGIVSYEGLVRLFECPGCHTLMVPPLLQCRKGHLICAKCRVNLKATCPICKQRITETSNYMMEQVCQLVKFPCQFGKFGCPEYHPPKQKNDHEHFCIYRPVECHYAAVGCDYVLPLKDMNTHITLCQYRLKGKGPRI